MSPPIVYVPGNHTTNYGGLTQQVTSAVIVRATATLTPSNMTGGSGPSSSITPPGWGSGTCPEHHNRGHLIGNKLGGPGDEAKNLVTLTAGTNHPMMYEYEDLVYNYVRAQPHGTACTYTVECFYDDIYYTSTTGFPVPGASGNPFCLFPAPAYLRLSLTNGGPVTLNTLSQYQANPPATLGTAGLATSLLVYNGGYKWYQSAVHYGNNCWAVVNNLNDPNVQIAARAYARALGYDFP
ncbi:DNA/RNA non-specific endonuclease [Insolitispirillum peregrinum]|uniref:DNA/RNA non-specific endonuclease n=1 Tax=Insolitispirillum peregrinum TaxID=80876 RepID=A0A1N7LMM9_9PROT|nr:DNA/RNA non-specific endonuclease [Insolitispirillum peregrinum]SIS75042.1 DNA/RNA non-specific endonuclease [Insolitispirillum peregrinum]